MATYIYLGNVSKTDKTTIIGVKGKQIRLGQSIELSDSEYEKLSERFIFKLSTPTQRSDLPKSRDVPQKSKAVRKSLLESDKVEVSTPKETPNTRKLNKLFGKE